MSSQNNTPDQSVAKQLQKIVQDLSGASWKLGTEGNSVVDVIKYESIAIAQLKALLLDARLTELDLLEQQINRWELPETIYKELNSFKLLRLNNLKQRIDQLTKQKSKGESKINS